MQPPYQSQQPQWQQPPYSQPLQPLHDQNSPFRPSYTPETPNTQYPPQFPAPPQYPPETPYYYPPAMSQFPQQLPMYAQQSQFTPPPQPPKKRGLPAWAWVLIVIFALGIIGSAANSQQSNTAPGAQPTTTTADPTQVPTSTPTPMPSLAYQLASIDAGGATPDGAIVAKYQTLLDALHRKTGDSEQAISDETVKGQQMLHDKGKDISLYDLMSAVNQGIPDGTKIRYAEALAALITLMENPQ